MDKVLVTLKIFNSFRSAFREFKGKLHTYFVGEKKPKLWEFQEQLIFKRFDSFVDRLDIVKEFFRTAQQFLKLEKVEIGGIRGRALSSRIGSVHEEFKVSYRNNEFLLYNIIRIHIIDNIYQKDGYLVISIA